MKDRTNVLITDHVQAVVDHLTTALAALTSPVPVGFGERPKNASAQLEQPPYAYVSFLAGGFMDGPLDDTQVDVALRVVVVCNGNTAHEAAILRDITNGEMQASNITVTGRKIRDIRLENPSDGLYRDDDVPTPIFYTRQIYLMDSVPA